uniref:Fungal-type protein kinase domain-containing protein n=1 Tax=Psilocybe cubensis TaxID=181762 RepID=A0A8H8CKS2_PSICU
MPKCEVYNALKKSDRQPPPSNRSNDRELRAIAMYRYRNLWKAADIEEFKRAFIYGVNCHFRAFQTGRVLHCNIVENNLIIYQHVRADRNEEENVTEYEDNASRRKASLLMTESKSVEVNEPRVRRVLTDFDVAVLLGPDGKPTVSSICDHHITGTIPFMARHLLRTPEERELQRSMYPIMPTYHLYRYDLESFLYILIWAATCYDLTTHKRLQMPKDSHLEEWSNIKSMKKTRQAKQLGHGLLADLEQDIRPEWNGLWKEWIQPLCFLFHDGLLCSDVAEKQGNIDDFITGGGLLTFDNFMKKIQVSSSDFNSEK